MANVKIRYRRRNKQGAPAGMRTSWDEWQVVDVSTREVLYRAELQSWAEVWAVDNGHSVVERP